MGGLAEQALWGWNDLQSENEENVLEDERCVRSEPILISLSNCTGEDGASSVPQAPYSARTHDEVSLHVAWPSPTAGFGQSCPLCVLK